MALVERMLAGPAARMDGGAAVRAEALSSRDGVHHRADAGRLEESGARAEPRGWHTSRRRAGLERFEVGAQSDNPILDMCATLFCNPILWIQHELCCRFGDP